MDNEDITLRDRLPVLAAALLSVVWIAFIVLYVRDLEGDLRDLNPATAAGLMAGSGGPLAACKNPS